MVPVARQTRTGSASTVPSPVQVKGIPGVSLRDDALRAALLDSRYVQNIRLAAEQREDLLK